MTPFEEWFATLAGARPHAWQLELGSRDTCGNLLVRIPTGFDKTLGVLAAWLQHRVRRGDDRWPRRLVWCLPMHVEQTEAEVRRILEAHDLLWNGMDEHAGKVGVHLLMGGTNSGQWYLYPEAYAVLIGTQDMLLSRAMNRGYGAPCARWPMEFGLLNQDALWVMDPTPADQESRFARPHLRVVEDVGDGVPPVRLCAAVGVTHCLLGFAVSLELAAVELEPAYGGGWTEWVLGLLRRHSPFAQAWMEALLRAADQRASRGDRLAVPLLEGNNAEHGLEAGHPEVAQAAPRGAATDPADPNPPQGGAQHGLRGGAGGPEASRSRTRAPHDATRHLTTTLGLISYAELGPHLSFRIMRIEADIVDGLLRDTSMDEGSILDLHRRVCGDQTPDIAVTAYGKPAYPSLFGTRLIPGVPENSAIFQLRVEKLARNFDERRPVASRFTCHG